MAECKNCIHYKACMHLIDIDKEELTVCEHFLSDVNVVEVVRCKDCVYWENRKDYTSYCNNIDGLNEPDTDDFCSYGERDMRV